MKTLSIEKMEEIVGGYSDCILIGATSAALGINAAQNPTQDNIELWLASLAMLTLCIANYP